VDDGVSRPRQHQHRDSEKDHDAFRRIKIFKEVPEVRRAEHRNVRIAGKRPKFSQDFDR